MQRSKIVEKIGEKNIMKMISIKTEIKLQKQYIISFILFKNIIIKEC